jgi:peptide/nickel transport system substrate-binding protein
MEKMLRIYHEGKFLGKLKLLAIFLFVLLAAGITADADADSRVLTVLVPAEFPHLDPAETISGDQYMVKYHIYNRLYRFSEKLEPIPELVVNESVSEDGTTWTFDIRPGVKFHDGTPCDAQAIKYTYDRMMKGGGRMQKALFSPIKESQVKSDTRVVMITDGLFPALRNNLSHPDAAIVCPTADQKLGKKFGRQPVGAGPYRFGEWVSGDHLTVIRNDQYYGKLPYFERIVFKFVGDATTRPLMVETGDADVALRVLPADVPRLKKNTSVTVGQIWGRNIYFALNCAKQPFNDVRVRRAANYAVDKQAIVDRILSGAGKPAHSLVEAVQGTIDAGFYEYNPDKAKALIKEAGATGSKVVLLSPTTRYLLDSEVAQAVAGYLRAVGLDVEVRAIGDWPSYVDIVRRRDFDMYMLGWGGSTGDPDNAFRLTLSGPRAGKLWNAGSYSNPEVDRLIVEGAKEFDQARRAEIYAKIQKMVWNEAPWLFMHRLKIFMAYKAGIEGIVTLPGTEMPYFWLAHE